LEVVELPGGELLIVLLILLLIFGASQLPKLARSMGQSKREFEAGLKEDDKGPRVEGPCPFCSADVSKGSKFCPQCGKSASDIIARKTTSPSP
jgi:sec-independent protein translocase protein TatA